MKTLILAIFALYFSLSFTQSVHAATINCAADGYTFDIRGLTAESQSDGSMKVTTMVFEYVLDPITVKGDFNQFEVLAPQLKGHAGTQGINHIYLAKDNGAYVLKTVTLCNPVYQEEKCIDPEDVLDVSIDRNVYCTSVK